MLQKSSSFTFKPESDSAPNYTRWRTIIQIFGEQLNKSWDHSTLICCCSTTVRWIVIRFCKIAWSWFACVASKFGWNHTILSRIKVVYVKRVSLLTPCLIFQILANKVWSKWAYFKWLLRSPEFGLLFQRGHNLTSVWRNLSNNHWVYLNCWNRPTVKPPSKFSCVKCMQMHFSYLNGKTSKVQVNPLSDVMLL